MSPLVNAACCCCPSRRPPPSRASSPQRKGLTLQDVPEDTLLDILSWVSKRDLIQNCRLVCKRWRYLVDLPVVWKRKCERLGFHLQQLEGSFPDWRAFFFSLSKRNLLRNVCGRAGLRYWELHPGDWMADWMPEDIPSGFKRRFFKMFKRKHKSPLPDTVWTVFVPTWHQDGGLRFFVKKKQRITLKDKGIPNWVMDEIKPQITVKDWYFNVDNSHYQLTVNLLSADCEVLQNYCKMFEVRERAPTVEEWREVKQNMDIPWSEMVQGSPRRTTTIEAKIYVAERNICQVSYVFENYPPGVRHVDFEHRVGWRSDVKVTNSSIAVDLV